MRLWANPSCSAVCGFGNLASAGINIGILVAMAPNKADRIIRLTPRALFTGILVSPGFSVNFRILTTCPGHLVDRLCRRSPRLIVSRTVYPFGVPSTLDGGKVRDTLRCCIPIERTSTARFLFHMGCFGIYDAKRNGAWDLDMRLQVWVLLMQH